VTFQGSFLWPAISAACGLTHDSVTTLSESQGCELPTSLSCYSCVIMGQESSFHGACRVLYCIAHAVRAAIKLTQCCYQGCAEGYERDNSPGHSRQWVIQSEITKSEFYQNLVTRPGVQNFVWILVARSNFSPDLTACPWLLRRQIWCLGKMLNFYGLTNFMLKWILCGSEGSDVDFCLFK